MLPDDNELTRLSQTCTYSDWPFAGVLAAEVIRLRAKLASRDAFWRQVQADALKAQEDAAEVNAENAALRARLEKAEAEVKRLRLEIARELTQEAEEMGLYGGDK